QQGRRSRRRLTWKHAGHLPEELYPPGDVGGIYAGHLAADSTPRYKAQVGSLTHCRFPAHGICRRGMDATLAARSAKAISLIVECMHIVRPWRSSCVTPLIEAPLVSSSLSATAQLRHRRHAMAVASLRAHLIEELTDLLDAETQLTKALPKMAAAATHKPL